MLICMLLDNLVMFAIRGVVIRVAYPFTATGGTTLEDPWFVPLRPMIKECARLRSVPKTIPDMVPWVLNQWKDVMEGDTHLSGYDQICLLEMLVGRGSLYP